MWKKMGNVQAGNCCSARSHLSKDEEPFLPFYDRHLAVPGADSASPQKSAFCEAYIHRHHSADKPRPAAQSRTHSDRSSLAPADSAPRTPQPSQDLFSLMRSHELVRRKSSLELQKGAVPDNALALLEQQLKAYREKWREARQKLLVLKEKQAELKSHVSSELGRWKRAVEEAVGELAVRGAEREGAVVRAGAVMAALEAAREFRGEQERWAREREGILARFNTSLDRLI